MRCTLALLGVLTLIFIFGQGCAKEAQNQSELSKQGGRTAILTNNSVAGCDGAGNCYVRAGATGDGSGSDWTNACSGFSGACAPASLIRGATYFVAAGNYGAVNFSTPDSGTLTVTIESPTTASHGTDVGWSSGYAGQALFGESFVRSDYWTFNGQTRNSDWVSGYNLKFWNVNDGSGASVSLAGSHVSFEYVEFEGTGMTGGDFPNNTTADRCTVDNCGAWGDAAIYGAASTSNQLDYLYVGHSYAHHTGNTQFQLNAYQHNYATFEYNWVSYNHTGQNGIHDEAYSIYWSNLVVRFNVFQDICGSGVITDAGANTPNLSNWEVYGNLFFWDSAYASFDGHYGLATIDNGVVNFLGENMSGHIYFYNNTMAGFYNTVADGVGTAFSTLPIAALGGYSSGAPAVVIENNLWYDSAYVFGDSGSYCSIVTGAQCIQDYNISYQGGVPSGDNWQTNSFPGPHDYNVSGLANPFVNSAPSTVAGFELLNDTPSGISLSSPYDIDVTGVLRGSDGVWNRGALQIAGSSVTPTPTPTPTPAPAASATPTPAASPIASATPAPSATPSTSPTPTGPSTTITFPANGNTVAAHSIVSIQASATSSYEISQVQFFVNGSLKCTIPGSAGGNSYACNWSVPKRIGKVYSLSTVATDNIGNTATSPTVYVTSK